MSRRARTIAIAWVATIGWAGVIFFLSAQSSLGLSLELSQDPIVNWVTRKAAHMFFYAVFAILALWAMRTLGGGRPVRWALALAAVYAATDELHQGFVAGRSPLVTDVLIDIGGAALGLALFRWFAPRRTRTEAEEGRS